jgi:valyl-tRNA synthetase
MSTELAKTFDPTTTQEQALKLWHDHNAFHAEPADPGKPYAIVIPPPNVTAALHLGHALNNTLQDILTRYHRMLGDNTMWMPGTDHAGIATQTVVEKRVFAEEGKRRTDFARDEFIGKIQAWKDEYEARITQQLKAMGCSCDFDRQAFTMDAPRAKAVREAFFQLFKDGLIYRGKRLVNWDPVTQTALADDEVENEEVDGHFYYLRYPLTDGTGHVTVATTRPETMLGDTAVAINPKDPRAATLKGKHVRLPIVNREIPIVEDDYVVMPVQFGGDPADPKATMATGFLKVTPAHDPNDYDIGRRHNLAVINVMAPDASISDKHGWTDVGDAGFVLGKTREDARKLVVDWFKRNGLLEEIKPYRHSVGHSYRSHVAIEPYLSDQWYCKVTDPRLSGAALRAIANDQFEGAKPNGKMDEWDGGLRFYPARYAKTFQTWHENLRDWCISRQLWWGHRIPVWRLPEGRLADRLAPAEFETAVETLVGWSRSDRVALTMRDERDQAPSVDIADRSLPYTFVCVRDPSDKEVIDRLERYGAVQDPDVLDTWFSSGLWPLSTLGWPEKTRELQTWNPTSVLCTAREIITLWVSRMVMFNLYFRNNLPFNHVFIHAMIQDGHGQKMSKTLGNGLDPMDVIATHGADALRFALAQMATNTQDVRMPVDMVDPYTGETFTPKYVTDAAGYQVAAPIQESPRDPKKKMVSSYGLTSGKAKPTAEMPLAKNTSGKFDLGRNFCNKLWNAARFVLSNLESAPVEPADETKWSLGDRWIVSRFNRTIAEVNDAVANYRFDQIAKACYDFFWRDFCDWYVEAVKPAMRDPARSGQTAAVLAALLDGTLRLLHPITPFITEMLFARLNEVRPTRGLPGRLECAPSTTLIRAPWPTIGSFAEAAEHIFPKLQEIIGAIRNLRNELKVQPRQKVDVSILAPAEPCRQLTENRELIESLATVNLKDIRTDLTPPPGAARTLAAGVEIFIDLGAPAGDTGLAEKRCAELKKLTETLRGRLSNEAYTKKAPPHLVKQTQDQLADAEAEMAKLGCK